jgi:hypothetical protein
MQPLVSGIAEMHSGGFDNLPLSLQTLLDLQA